MNNILNEFSKDNNKSFGDCVKYLLSQGYSKDLAEKEVKKHFTHNVEPIPNDIFDKDIIIDIFK